MDDCEQHISSGFANSTVTVTMEEYWYCSVQYQLHILKTYVPPLLIVIGSIGNVLAFVVLTRKNLRQWPICYYLSILTIVNTLVLYFGCGLDWLSYVTGIPYIVALADWICRIWQFMFNVIRYFTNWLMAAMTIDRFLTMWLPHKAQHLCTVFMAKVVTIIILIGLIVISVHALWIFELVNGRCSFGIHGEFHTLETVWPWVSAVMYSYVPTVIVFVMMSLMLIGLCHPNVCLDPTPAQNRFTAIVIILAILFILLTLPMIIINLIQYGKPPWMANQNAMIKLWMAAEISQVLSCINHSVTFVLYFAMLPMLRTELCCMVQRLVAQCHRHHPTPTTELSHLEANGGIKQEDGTTVTLL